MPEVRTPRTATDLSATHRPPQTSRRPTASRHPRRAGPRSAPLVWIRTHPDRPQRVRILTRGANVATGRTASRTPLLRCRARSATPRSAAALWICTRAGRPARVRIPKTVADGAVWRSVPPFRGHHRTGCPLWVRIRSTGAMSVVDSSEIQTLQIPCGTAAARCAPSRGAPTSYRAPPSSGAPTFHCAPLSCGASTSHCAPQSRGASTSHRAPLSSGAPPSGSAPNSHGAIPSHCVTVTLLASGTHRLSIAPTSTSLGPRYRDRAYRGGAWLLRCSWVQTWSHMFPSRGG